MITLLTTIRSIPINNNRCFLSKACYGHEWNLCSGKVVTLVSHFITQFFLPHTFFGAYWLHSKLGISCRYQLVQGLFLSRNSRPVQIFRHTLSPGTCLKSIGQVRRDYWQVPLGQELETPPPTNKNLNVKIVFQSSLQNMYRPKKWIPHEM